MTDNAAGFAGNIPEHYDRGLGPILFADYADDIARRAAACGPKQVLETAAGTGFVTRRLRDLLPAAQITATDLNPAMLRIAAAKFGPDEDIAFHPADATSLPFADNRFDAVVCQFGVMFYPDKETSYREAHRVLAPNGRYFFSVWDSFRHNPLGRIAHQIAGSFYPTDPPRFYEVPFGYHQIDTIKESLIDAGFAGITIDIVKKEKMISDPAALADGIVFGNPLIDQIRARGGVDPQEVADAMTQALQRQLGGALLPLQAILIEARKN